LWISAKVDKFWIKSPDFRGVLKANAGLGKAAKGIKL
jgi:hypothetical protein